MLRKAVVNLIKAYRYFISPILGPNCRFYPTCSEYASVAVTRFGILRGCWLSIKRLLCCHPFHQGGIDEVPKIEETGT